MYGCSCVLAVGDVCVYMLFRTHRCQHPWTVQQHCPKTHPKSGRFLRIRNVERSQLAAARARARASGPEPAAAQNKSRSRESTDPRPNISKARPPAANHSAKAASATTRRAPPSGTQATFLGSLYLSGPRAKQPTGWRAPAPRWARAAVPRAQTGPSGRAHCQYRLPIAISPNNTPPARRSSTAAAAASRGAQVWTVEPSRRPRGAARSADLTHVGAALSGAHEPPLPRPRDRAARPTKLPRATVRRAPRAPPRSPHMVGAGLPRARRLARPWAGPRRLFSNA